MPSIQNRALRWSLTILSLLLLLGIVAGISLGIGNTDIPVSRILSTLWRGEPTTEYVILVNVRLPRILLAFAVGGALSLAGVVLQGLFRNPLVEPYTLGISGGASLGVCLAIVFGIGSWLGHFMLPVFGFGGALLVILAIYALSIRRGMMDTNRMLLTGVMISFISSSAVMLLMAVSRTEDLHGIVFWIMGSLDEPSRGMIATAIVVSLLGLVTAYGFSVGLNAMLLGESEALHLGVHVERMKKILFVIASLLTGVCVAVAGNIGFVGLVVPHFVRLVVGADHRILLISAYLSGASFLILCDTLARIVIDPLPLPVGVITGLIGGPVLVIALNRGRRYE